jgi:hypothetical protein
MGGGVKHSLGMLGLVLSLGVAGCDKHGLMTPLPDGGGPPSGSALTLGITIVAPQVEGLVLTSGMVEFPRVSLYGDTAADMRTMAHVEMALPADTYGVTFPNAPYGLYSRAQVPLDDVRAHGTWKGTPLEIGIEAEPARVDLLGPTLDYEPSMSAAFLITLDDGAWLTPAILDSATVGTDGTIHIDQVDNPGAVSAIVTALEGAFTLTQAPAQ